MIYDLWVRNLQGIHHQMARGTTFTNELHQGQPQTRCTDAAQFRNCRAVTRKIRGLEKASLSEPITCLHALTVKIYGVHLAQSNGS